MRAGFVLGAACLLLGASAASLDEQGFVRDWIVSGPWPSYQSQDVGQGLDTDFLQGEDAAEPYPGKPETATFVADWGKLVASVGSSNEWGFKTNATFDATWRPLKAEKNGTVNLNGRFLPIEDYHVAYAACYVEIPEARDAEVWVGSDDDHKLYLNADRIGRRQSTQGVTPGNFKYPVRLPEGKSRLLFKLQDRIGDAGFCVQLMDAEGRPLKAARISLDPRGSATVLDAQLAARRSPEKLAERMETARRAIARLEAEIAREKARTDSLEEKSAAAKKALDAAYADYESKCRAAHDAARRGARPGVDEPFEPQALRSSLCVNGLWETSTDGGKTWRLSRVPCQQMNSFFHTWFYPVKDGKPLPGYEADFDPLNGSPKARYRTHFTYDGKGAIRFRCDAIIRMKAVFYLNGEEVGTWAGDRGQILLPLPKAKVGDNVFEIATAAWGNQVDMGVRGDLFFEQTGRVRVDETWIRTSWRKSEISVETTLVNDTDRDVEAEVACYAVKDGRVRFRLGTTRARIAAGGRAVTRRADGWADPKLWGICGDWGEPNMYTLVTDVTVGGRLVDRAEEPFGFREFWIHATDFYLNGRRIFFQGDVGGGWFDAKRCRDISWDLLRRHGINLVRMHDTDQWSLTAVRDADRMGMAIYAQSYPLLHTRGREQTAENFIPYEKWLDTEEHRDNLAAYTRWWKSLRNHPSVLIWSTDNEVVTQANDFEWRAELSVRNERVAAFYEKFVKSLDPTLVMTRDGDIATWNSRSRWFEDPPCDTANYHYPDFALDAYAKNWQKVYEYRPVIFGETLYCAYFHNGWVGALPELVEKKAAQLRDVIRLYRELEVPCVIYMGVSGDCFSIYDDSGKGNPWGMKKSDMRNPNRPKGSVFEHYPWLRIDWPALSGEGSRPPACNRSCSAYGHGSLNYYDPTVPSHVRNACNEAYCRNLRQHGNVDVGWFAEAVVTAEAGAPVWTTTPAGNRTGVRADRKGRAWFRALEPGRRAFATAAAEKTVDLPRRGDDVTKPGFVNIPRIDLAAPAVRNIRGENEKENYFRKSVRLARKPVRAVVRIYADTGYELFVNGRLAASLAEWANTRDYDLTPFFRAGGNLIAIRQSNRCGHRALAFELVADGRRIAVSDGSWKTFPTERWGWILPDFDDSGWKPAKVMDMSAAGGPQWKGTAGDGSVPVVPTLENCPFFTGAIPKALDSPFYRAEPLVPVAPPQGLADVAGPDYAQHALRPLPTVHRKADVLRIEPRTGTVAREGAALRLTAPDRWTGPSFVVDLGEETVGFFRMRVASEGTVAFRTHQAESLSEALSEPDRMDPSHRIVCHEYRLEKGVQEFESRDRMGGRFVRVEFFDTPETVTVDGFSLRWSLYPVRKTGYFRCDDEVVNAAWRAAERTLHLNMQEFYLDAIKRDRLLWVGDARAEQLSNFVLFGDTALFEFCWRKMAEHQFASGAMPSSFGEGLSVIWDFNAWYVIALGEYIDWTGRTDFPASLAGTACGVTDWMIARTGADGLIDLPENPIRPLWMVALNAGKGRDTFVNSVFLDMLRAAERICRAAGRTDDADRYAAHARKIASAVARLHAEKPLASHPDNLFSPQMFHYTIERQATAGDVAGAFALLRQNMVRMLASGLGTLPENMPVTGDTPSVTDPKAGLGLGSLCHGWQALLTCFISRHIAGVTPLEPGCRRIAIRPNPCALKSFVSVTATPLGGVGVACDGKGYDIWLPEGMTAEFSAGGRTETLKSGRSRR